jgi:hypothetical protein
MAVPSVAGGLNDPRLPKNETLSPTKVIHIKASVRSRTSAAPGVICPFAVVVNRRVSTRMCSSLIMWRAYIGSVIYVIGACDTLSGSPCKRTAYVWMHDENSPSSSRAAISYN